MADASRRKGLSDYRREADCVPEKALKQILETYSTSSENIGDIIQDSRKVLSYCILMTHGDNTHTPPEISRALEQVRKQASGLSALLSIIPPTTADRIKEAAFKDRDIGLVALGRGDPFAQEARFDDALTAVEALARWAAEVQDGSEGAKRGRPVKDAPAACVAALGRFYQRLTGRAPSRVTKQAEAPGYGHVEGGDFGRFARDLARLVKVDLSDDALKRGIARLKVKKAVENRPNSPFDVTILSDPD